MKEQIWKIAPDRVHPILEGVYISLFPDSANSPENHYCKPICPEAISDTKLLQDREELLKQLDENGTVAELGVDTGDFSERILSITNPSELYLVDIWDSERYDDNKFEGVKQRFSEHLASERVKILRQRSDVSLQQFDDDYFDWVYIDTTHSYRQTKRELKLASDKVKQGGIIAGHDYSLGTPYKRISYGVIEAVHEFCNEYGWKIEYLTLETSGNRSFALTEM